MLITLFLILLAAGAIHSLGQLVKLSRFDVLAVILIFLLLSHELELSGLINRIAIYMIRLLHGSTVFLYVSLAVIVYFSSSIIMNDTAIFVFTPLALTLSSIASVDRCRSIAIVCIAANLGSALTPFGNPQNIIIWIHYRVSLWRFFSTISPSFLAMLPLFLLYVYILVYRAKPLEVRMVLPSIRFRVLNASIALVLLGLTVFLVQIELWYYALAIVVAAMILLDPYVFKGIDYVIIAVFALMFIDFSVLSTYIIGLAKQFLASRIGLYIVSVIASQAVSNVPATIILIQYTRDWATLAVGVNIGGLGLLYSSMANVIAIRLARISIKKFHKYYIPFFLVALLTGLTILFLLYP